MSSRKRAGDWMCPNCNFLIFAGKKSCRKCGATKSSKSVERRKKKKYGHSADNEWICSNCSSSNFPDRDKCRKCKMSRPHNIKLSNTKNQKHEKQKGDNDWMCNSCKMSNFYHREKCRKCHTLKPSKSVDIKPIKPIKPSPTDKHILLTKHRLNILINGYLNQYRNDKLLLLLQYFINYCSNMEFKYFEILINKTPNKELGIKSEDGIDGYLKDILKPNSRYFFDINKCPKCHASDTDLLQFHCSYQKKNKWKCYNYQFFNNMANEYKCKQCEFYVAFSFKNKNVGWKYQLSPFGSREEKYNHIKYRKDQNDNKKCPDCNDTMKPLERIHKSEYSPSCHGDGEYFSAETRETMLSRDLCTSCDLVLSKEDSWLS